MSDNNGSRNIKQLFAPIVYVINSEDNVLNIDTSLGVATLYISNIKSSGAILNNKTIYINDVGNNAGVNNIIINTLDGDTINGLSSLLLKANGISAEISVSDTTNYQANLSTDTGTSGGTVTGANNGLTLNGTVIQLGGSLIQPTVIVTDSLNTLVLTDAFGTLLQTRNINANFLLSSFGASTYISSNYVLEIFSKFNNYINCTSILNYGGAFATYDSCNTVFNFGNYNGFTNANNVFNIGNSNSVLNVFSSTIIGINNTINNANDVSVFGNNNSYSSIIGLFILGSNNNNLIINGINGETTITQLAGIGTRGLAVDFSGKLIVGGASLNKYSINQLLTATISYTVTHNLNSTNVVIALWDSVVGDLILGFSATNRTANSFDIVVSSTSNYDIIVIG